jgi:hypothetical protein
MNKNGNRKFARMPITAISQKNGVIKSDFLVSDTKIG